MNLLKLSSNKTSFKTIEFNSSGLSIILGKRTVQEEEGNQTPNRNTYNGVGKTLSNYLVSYCLGSDSNESFEEKLKGWIFKLEFEIGGVNYISERNVDEQEHILFNGTKLDLTTYRVRLQELLFPKIEGFKYLTFRSLVTRFLKTRREAYNNYLSTFSREKPYQQLINAGYLFGLDLELIQKKLELRSEYLDTSKRRKKLKDDEVFKRAMTDEEIDPDSKLEFVYERNNLVEELKEFKIAENYQELEEKYNESKKELIGLRNLKFILERNIDQINETLSIQPDLDIDEISGLYEEIGVSLPETKLRQLDEVVYFYDRLKKNRNSRLFEKKKDLVDELESIKKAIGRINSIHDSNFQMLNEYGALEEFMALNSRLNEVNKTIEKLESFDNLIASYKAKEAEIKKSMLEQDGLAESFLEINKERLDDLKLFFITLAKSFYPNKKCNLNISNNTGNNQTRFNIEAHIESDNSDGINEVLIFCFDLIYLFKGENHNLDFLFHDSRILSDIDPIQRSIIFKEISKNLDKTNKQYIISANEDQLNSIKEFFNPDEYESIIEDNVILELKDDSVDSKLLGVNVEVDY
ncbi:MAG: DUF2326 domain-containing protein [Balneolaceae bacterium]